MTGKMIAGVLASLFALSPAAAQNADHASDQPLFVALDIGERPFAFMEANGTPAGFSRDLADKIAEKLGRPSAEIVDVNFSALFAGLFAKRYEMSSAPIVIRPERAEQMLFSEPFLDTALAFATRTGQGFTELEGLAGKTIAVNTGGSHDQWVTENAEKYGFTIERYNKTPDALQAVAAGRADVVLSEEPVVRSFTTLAPNIEVSYVIETGLSFGMVFRKEDEAFRDQVEKALECIKLDGTMSELHKKWFGTEPKEGGAAATAMSGYGAPGFVGFRESDDAVGCS